MLLVYVFIPVTLYAKVLGIQTWQVQHQSELPVGGSIQTHNKTSKCIWLYGNHKSGKEFE